MKALYKLFDTDEKLSNHLNSLWSTRAGLLKITETSQRVTSLTKLQKSSSGVL